MELPSLRVKNLSKIAYSPMSEKGVSKGWLPASIEGRGRRPRNIVQWIIGHETLQ